ncbi:hypothetical protein BS47DRAFT_959358 [Hydnum rufescens UP504]|uniref:Uncharacterized protein n=1 Tax=Hydnum rufescens UP504 TaxID=1448309 RepID=A0A9P6AX99_9AGAM|nr:hypothetical protein BS47DRAFT_959358 [Hydnum rufescens UP504]
MLQASRMHLCETEPGSSPCTPCQYTLHLTFPRAVLGDSFALAYVIVTLLVRICVRQLHPQNARWVVIWVTLLHEPSYNANYSRRRLLSSDGIRTTSKNVPDTEGVCSWLSGINPRSPRALDEPEPHCRCAANADQWSNVPRT